MTHFLKFIHNYHIRTDLVMYVLDVSQSIRTIRSQTPSTALFNGLVWALTQVHRVSAVIVLQKCYDSMIQR